MLDMIFLIVAFSHQNLTVFLMKFSSAICTDITFRIILQLDFFQSRFSRFVL